MGWRQPPAIERVMTVTGYVISLTAEWGFVDGLLLWVACIRNLRWVYDILNGIWTDNDMNGEERIVFCHHVRCCDCFFTQVIAVKQAASHADPVGHPTPHARVRDCIDERAKYDLIRCTQQPWHQGDRRIQFTRRIRRR